MLIGTILILAVLSICYFYVWLQRYRYHSSGWRRRRHDDKTTAFPRQPPKPAWVRKEIIRLKALMPHDGCRTIAHTFNRLYAGQRCMTVGKTYVSYTIRKHQYEIQVLRMKLKHRRPRPMPKHLIWGMDLTYLADHSGHAHPILGIVEHQSRVSLTLKALETKASIVLLRKLLDTIEACGPIKPRYLRTDNEAVFTSFLFRFGLWLLSIRHQRIERCCPWQNGRIERFFGTLKSKTRELCLTTTGLQRELDVFRFWYNRVRPHQHLDGLTPAEVYDGARINGRSRNRPVWFDTWDGALTGFFIPP